MTFQQHYLTPVRGLRDWWHPIGVVYCLPGRVLGGGGRCPWKTLVLEKLGVKVQGGLGEVQNEALGPKLRLPPPPVCLCQRLKIGMRLCCGDRYCVPIYSLGGRYPGKALVLVIPGGVNMFVGVANDLPAALPHANPRLKIFMAPHWRCRVTPPPLPPGRGLYPRKTLVLEKLRIKVQGVLMKYKMNL